MLRFLLRLGCLGIGICNSIWAQDVHFSQIPNIPTLINPAKAGFFKDYNYRVSTIYRLQATPFGSVYNTFMGWADVAIQPRNFSKGWMGLGINVIRDNTTGSILTTNKGYLSVAYHHILSPELVLSVALSSIYIDRGLDPSKLLFGDQFNGVRFDGNIPTGDIFFLKKSRYFSLLPTFMLTYSFSTHNRIIAGFGMENVNVPTTTFIQGLDASPKKGLPTNKSKYIVPLRYHINLDYTRRLSNILTFNTHSYITFQEKAHQILLGAGLNYDLSRRQYLQFKGGLMYRVNRSAIILLGMESQKFKLGISYDLSITQTRRFYDNYPTFEFSATFHSLFANPKKKYRKASNKERNKVQCFGFGW